MTAGTGEAGGEPVFDRVAGLNRHDRQARMILGGDGGRVTLGHDHGDLARDQFVDELRQTVELPMRRAPLEHEVLPRTSPCRANPRISPAPNGLWSVGSAPTDSSPTR